jgi:hypothetical protein
MAGTRPIYYWDTCIFLAWLKDEKTRKPGEMEGVEDALGRFKRREVELMTSTITVIEASAAKIETPQFAQFEDAIQRTNFSRISVDIPVAKLARNLRDYYHQRVAEFRGLNLSIPDAIHVASAILYKATEMHTFDEKDKTKFETLGLIPLSGNVGGYNLKICHPPGPMQGRLGLMTP